MRLVVVARADFALAKTESKHTDIFNRAFDQHVCPDNLAGALELFLCAGFRNAGSANLVCSAQTADCRNLPQILSVLRKPLIAATVFTVALFPIAQAWDHAFADEELARRAETKIEQFELRAISLQIDGPFIAPWWFSPAVSYWSRQAGVGGSSHESIQGIVETAKFFEAQDAEEAMQIIDRHNVGWIVSYDADRVAQNSAQILGNPVPKNAWCYLLDRHASEVPPFLRLIAQTGHFKLFRAEKS